MDREDAIDLNSREASAHFGYAMANEKMGCTDIALAGYEKAAMLSPGNIEYATALNKFREQYKNSIKESVEDFTLVENEENKLYLTNKNQIIFFL